MLSKSPDSSGNTSKNSAQHESVRFLLAETVLDKCYKGKVSVDDLSFLTAEMLLLIRDEWFRDGGY